MRIYFDSSTLVYYVERVQPWYARIVAKLSALNYDSIISDLTRMECLVQPIRMKNSTLIVQYEKLFATCQIVALTSTVIDRATRIRADYAFKTPDAIQLAAAIEGASDRFLTNDHQLARFTGIAVDLI